MSAHNPSFDPSGVGIKNGNIFGFPYHLDSSELVIIPVPWDVTTSYQAGTSNAPKAILDASVQLDFVDLYVEKAWESKIYMHPVPEDILEESRSLREMAAQHIHFLENGGAIAKDPVQLDVVKKINQGSAKMNQWLFDLSKELLFKGKQVCVLGGDHSSPLGYMKAIASQHDSFGLLHIDAHADLRVAYEDFEYSHASIMHNALKIPELSKLVQVGIRDLSPDEKQRIKEDERIQVFYDHDIKKASFSGKDWQQQCREIVAALPEKVYISFDIDGLDPKLCPNTGTPVPGGFEMEEVFFLFHAILGSGKKIIGFDLCEVNPDEKTDWNENVGARVLFRLCALLLKSKAIS